MRYSSMLGTVSIYACRLIPRANLLWLQVRLVGTNRDQKLVLTMAVDAAEAGSDTLVLLAVLGEATEILVEV